MTHIIRSFSIILSTLALGAAAAAQPLVTGINKTDFPLSGRVAITGTGFGAEGTVYVAGRAAWVSTWTDTRVVAYVPETAPIGPASIFVANDSGNSSAVSVTLSARVAAGRLRWRFEVDGTNLWYRPALAPDGTVYVHTNNASGQGLVYALSPDGGLRWIQKVIGYPYVPPSAGPDGAVYVGSIGRVYRISAQGNVEWTYWDGSSRGPRVAPAVGPDGLLYGAFEGGIGAFAIDPSNGTVMHSNPGTPLLSDKKGDATEMRFGPRGQGQPVDQAYVSMDGGASFYAFALGGLQQRFTAALNGNISGSAEVAVGSDGTIYGPSSLGLEVVAIDPTDGHTLWRYYPGPADWAVGTNNVEIGPDDMLYFVGSSAKLEAFDPHSQSRRWQTFSPDQTLGRPAVTPDGSTLVLAGTNTSVYGHPGFIKAFKTGNGRELWSVDLPFQLGPAFRVYGTHHPRITPDGATAYVSTLTLAEWPLSQDPHAFLYAVDLAPAKGGGGGGKGGGGKGGKGRK